MTAVIRAGGGVLWRPAAGGGVEVALVHRPRYDDWSLPKGKAEPGEHVLTCALREVEEETGFTSRAGQPLGTSRYLVMSGRHASSKTVRWWALQATGGRFTASREVDELRWLPPGLALRAIRGERGAGALRRFMRAKPATRTLVLVRNATAARAADWTGAVAGRPLLASGQKQAEALAGVLVAYRPTYITSAPPVRCVDTVKPLAAAVGFPVDIDPTLDGATSDAGSNGRHDRLLGLLGDHAAVVACSHGSATTDLLRGFTDGSESATRHGAAWALTFDGTHLVGLDRWIG